MLHILEDIDDIDHDMSPDMLVHDVECLLLHWRDVDALPLVRHWCSPAMSSPGHGTTSWQTR